MGLLGEFDEFIERHRSQVEESEEILSPEVMRNWQLRVWQHELTEEFFSAIEAMQVPEEEAFAAGLAENKEHVARTDSPYTCTAALGAMRVRRARDSRQRRFLLHDLNAALQFPYLAKQFAAKGTGTNLKAFGMWLVTRRCKVCQRPIPPDHEKCCSSRCSQRLRRWKRAACIKRRGGHPKHEFAASVKEIIPMRLLIERLGITEEEAERRAEADVRRGKLLVYRGPFGGRIRYVGQPRQRQTRT